MFSKNVRCMESNEAEVLAILEAFQIFVLASIRKPLVVKSNSLNVLLDFFYRFVSLEVPIPFQRD